MLIKVPTFIVVLCERQQLEISNAMPLNPD